MLAHSHRMYGIAPETVAARRCPTAGRSGRPTYRACRRKPHDRHLPNGWSMHDHLRAVAAYGLPGTLTEFPVDNR